MKYNLVSNFALGAALCSSAPAHAAPAADPPGRANGAPQGNDQNSPLPEPVTDQNARRSGDTQSTGSSGDIIVTGSRIRGAAPVGSTVIGLDRQDIAATSAVSTAEVFRNIPQVVNVGVNETNRATQGGGNNFTYANSINLRGVGPNATLMLINGHRVIAVGNIGTYNDPSIVPLLGLQRVEVVADGASAIYGSDAIAGVVNLILRRDLDGVEVSARSGAAENYWTRQAAIGAGKVWDSGQVMIAFEYSGHSALRGLDRPYVVGDQRYRGGPDFRTTNCNPGNIVTGGVSYAIPTGGVTAANRGALAGGTFNRCDLGVLVDIIPEISRNGFVATARQEITSGITLSADGYYYWRDFSRTLPAPSQPLTVPRTNAFFVAPPGTNPASETVQYYFGRELGTTISNSGGEKAWQGTVSLDVDLPSRWKLGLMASHGEERGHQGTPGLNASALTAALASSDPATAFNPFGPGTSQAVVNAIGDFRTLQQATAEMWQLEAKVDGPLFALPGGPVRAALGVGYYAPRFTVQNVTGPASAFVPGVRVGHKRTVKAGFAELLIPLFGPDNATPGFHRLEIDLAGRYDSYSDAGHTANPKIGINWDPVEGVRLRGSWGTSFRAPNLNTSVTTTRGLIPTTFADPLSPTGTSTGYVWLDAHPGLSPETAETWSAGIDFTAVRGLNLSATYFNIVNEGQILSEFGDTTILQREALFPTLVFRNTSPGFAQLLSSLLSQYSVINGAPLGNPAWIVDVRSNNLGVTKIDGIDFIGNYRLTTSSAGTFGLGLSGVWYNHYKVAQTALAPLTERSGLINFPVRYKLRGNANWMYRDFRANVFLNYVPSYSNNAINPPQRVASWTTIDLNLTQQVPVGSGSWAKKMEFSINVTNLFDRNPPLVTLAPSTSTSGGFDVQQANPLGRLITASVTIGF